MAGVEASQRDVRACVAAVRRRSSRAIALDAPRRVAAAAALAMLLAACAPDAFRRDPEFEAWLREIRTACDRERIGQTRVGHLLGSTGSREGGHFLNQTSRLYAGLITPAQWTTNVTAFISGRASDPGVQCVLERLPKKE